jgi:hypothetical protein
MGLILCGVVAVGASRKFSDAKFLFSASAEKIKVFRKNRPNIPKKK